MSDKIQIGNSSFDLEHIVRTPKATKKNPTPKDVNALIPAFEDNDVNVTRSNFLNVMGSLFDYAQSKGTDGGAPARGSSGGARRGFAAMPEEKQRAIASKGGESRGNASRNH